MANFVGLGVFDHETISKGDFDYMKVIVPAGSFKFPDNYGGRSGGGFWLIPLEVDANGDPATIGPRAPILAGVEFSQSERDSGERILTGHGSPVYLWPSKAKASSWVGATEMKQRASSA